MRSSGIREPGGIWQRTRTFETVSGPFTVLALFYGFQRSYTRLGPIFGKRACQNGALAFCFDNKLPCIFFFNGHFVLELGMVWLSSAVVKTYVINSGGIMFPGFKNRYNY